MNFVDANVILAISSSSDFRHFDRPSIESGPGSKNYVGGL